MKNILSMRNAAIAVGIGDMIIPAVDLKLLCDEILELREKTKLVSTPYLYALFKEIPDVKRMARLGEYGPIDNMINQLVFELGKAHGEIHAKRE